MAPTVSAVAVALLTWCVCWEQRLTPPPQRCKDEVKEEWEGVWGESPRKEWRIFLILLILMISVKRILLILVILLLSLVGILLLRVRRAQGARAAAAVRGGGGGVTL